MALETGLFDRVLVTTDDEATGQLARELGAEVPFIRPKHLADDFAPTAPVIAHAIDELETIGPKVQWACCIYPCAPFARAADIFKGLAQAIAERAHFAYPVARYPHPIQRAMSMNANGRMQFMDSTAELTRTQDLSPTFFDAGQFYWGRAEAWRMGLRMHTDGIGFEIPHWRVVDIDTPDDWLRAELLFRAVSQEAGASEGKFGG